MFSFRLQPVLGIVFDGLIDGSKKIQTAEINSEISKTNEKKNYSNFFFESSKTLIKKDNKIKKTEKLKYNAQKFH
jgi:hypothetical protein